MSSLTQTGRARAVPLIAVLFLAIAAYQVAATLVFPAMPAIGVRLGATPADLPWSQSVFFAVAGLSAAALPLSDRFGRKRVLLVVIALGILGSILIVASDTLALFNLGRWLQAPGVIALP